MVEGARNALLGYLYQLVGTAAVRVREVADGDAAWARLITRAESSLHSEEFNQDAMAGPLAAPGAGATAVQFKHSAVTANTVERSELLDILCGFDRSRNEAAEDGVTIDRYCLITNRHLAASAQEVIDHAKSQTKPHPSLVLPPSTKAGKPIAEHIKRLAPHSNDANAAAVVWHEILRNLDVLPGVASASDLLRLRKFAARYGVLEHEWNDRLNALIGAFVSGTASGGAIDVTREWLKEQLVGDPEAANLDFTTKFAPHISAACQARLDGRLKHEHRVPEYCYLERPAHQELQAALMLHPVVFVYGGGGCGKSLAVAQYLSSVADRQLVWSESAGAATEATIASAIATAQRPRRQLGDGSFGAIRSRLDAANPGRHPIWTIDLDGVDEAPERRPELSQLIRLCWAHGSLAASPASLVVTCRATTGTRTREQLVSHWLGTPESDLVTNVGFVSLGPFRDHELLEAARLRVEQPEWRIIRTLTGEDATDVLNRAGDDAPVSGEILKTLRHPVVWGTYASLTEIERNGVLDQNPDQLRLLALRLHNRFLGRCRVRRGWRDELMVERALPAIARATAGQEQCTVALWNQTCQSDLGLVEANDLYSECLSYGIIERESGTSWRWGHPFLAGYLATLDGGHADE